MMQTKISIKKFLWHHFKKNSLNVILLIVFLGFNIAFNKHFLTVNNLLNILNQITIVAMIGCGTLMLMIAGQVDLSTESLIGLISVMSAAIIQSTGSTLLVILAVLVVGVLAGVMNGFFVTRFHLPSFIVTIATTMIIRGIAYALTNRIPITASNSTFGSLWNNFLFGIPYVAYLSVLIIVITGVLLKITSYGRYLYAIGGNQEAARASGVRVNRIKMIAFITGGVITSIAGFALTSRLNVGISTLGSDFEIYAIFVAVIGGASIFGGVGSIGGLVIGSIVFGVMRNLLSLFEISQSIESIAIGALVLLAITVKAKSGRK